MKKQCDSIKESITAYLLDDLEKEQTGRVREHLEHCPECRAVADGLKPTLELVSRSLSATSDGPDRLDEEHRQRILTQGGERKRNIFQMSAALGIPLRMVALLIASIGMFILVLPVLQTARERGQLQQTAANGRNMIQSMLGRETQDIYVRTRARGAGDGRIKSEVSAVSARAPKKFGSGEQDGEEVEVLMMEMVSAPKQLDEKLPSDSPREAEMRVSDLESYADQAERLRPQREDTRLNMPAPRADEAGKDMQRPLVMKALFAGRSVGGRARNREADEPKPPDSSALKPDVSRLSEEADTRSESAFDQDHTRSKSSGVPAVNPFVATAKNAFSTFAIDCDTASYTIARNHLREGRRPAPETVRVEEFVNFFDYRYPPPRHRLFAVRTECAPSPFGRGLHLLNIGVKGRRLGRDQQRPAVLTFVIDTSGSMNTPDRIGLVRQALERLVGELAPTDEVAIVTFGSQARLMLEHTRAEQGQKIIDTIESLSISGSTHLEKGLLMAYEQAARHFRAGAVNRVILLSDGNANLGSDLAEDILKQAEKYREQGIFCSIFGFGAGGYNDQLLEALANKGDGTYAFIDSKEEVERVFVDDLDATLQIIAADAKIQVEFDPRRVVRYRQLGYENRRLRRQDFRDDGVDAGEVGSGQSVTALYELELKGQSELPLGVVRVRAFDVVAERVVEIEAPIHPPRVADFERASAGFKLAAVAAEAAEILRGSPFASENDFEKLLQTARPLAQQLYLDQHVQEFLRLLKMADGLAR